MMIRRGSVRGFTMFSALAFAACACNAFAQVTPGERFREVLAQIDKNCRLKKVGPYLDPSDPEYRRKQGNTSCDILTLHPRDWREVKMVKLDSQPHPVPEHWLATPEGRFAHAIKLPPPHDKPADVYRKGMGQREYFEALCKAEAGDSVFRAVQDVDGVRRLREPEVGIDDLLRHLYAPESILSHSIGQLQTFHDTLGESLVQPPAGRYRAAETPVYARLHKEATPYLRFVRDSARVPPASFSAPDGKGGWASVRRVVASDGIREPTQRYGFTWRGIARPFDRENGISGTELIVLDTTTMEVLGIRRAFRVTGVSRAGAWWLTAAHCSRELTSGYGSFLNSVLVPRNAE